MSTIPIINLPKKTCLIYKSHRLSEKTEFVPMTMKICWLFRYSSISIATLSQVCVFKKKNNNNNPNVLHKYHWTD